MTQTPLVSRLLEKNTVPPLGEKNGSASVPAPLSPLVTPVVADWSPLALPSPLASLLTSKMPPKDPSLSRVDAKAMGPLSPVKAASAAGALTMAALKGSTTSPVASMARSARRRLPRALGPFALRSGCSLRMAASLDRTRHSLPRPPSERTSNGCPGVWVCVRASSTMQRQARDRRASNVTEFRWAEQVLVEVGWVKGYETPGRGDSTGSLGLRSRFPWRSPSGHETEGGSPPATALRADHPSARTIATIFSPHSVGFCATWTPAALSASILAWAVP